MATQPGCQIVKVLKKSLYLDNKENITIVKNSTSLQ